MEINRELLSERMLARVCESELFSKRFGSFSKSDYEVLMFTVYLDTIEGEVRDYDLSIALGIPESKVRSLRIKSQLLYPRDIDWVSEVSKALEKGYYDDEQQTITITIEDPSVRNRIRYAIERNGGIVNLSLNSKQLILPVEGYILLATFAETNPDTVLRQIKSKLQKTDLLVSEIRKDGFRKRFIDKTNRTAEVLESCKTLFSIGAPIITSLVKFL